MRFAELLGTPWQLHWQARLRKTVRYHSREQPREWRQRSPAASVLTELLQRRSWSARSSHEQYGRTPEWELLQPMGRLLLERVARRVRARAASVLL